MGQVTLNPEAANALAIRLLEIAEEVERAEGAIKKQLLEAAERGDVGRVSRLVRRWMEVPVIEVLQEDALPESRSRHKRGTEG